MLFFNIYIILCDYLFVLGVKIHRLTHKIKETLHKKNNLSANRTNRVEEIDDIVCAHISETSPLVPSWCCPLARLQDCILHSFFFAERRKL